MRVFSFVCTPGGTYGAGAHDARAYAGLGPHAALPLPLTYAAPAPTIGAVVHPDQADADLLAAGREVETLAVEFEPLREMWPVAKPVTRRAEIGRE